MPQRAQTSALRSADKLPRAVMVIIGIAHSDAAKPRDGDVVFEALHHAAAGRLQRLHPAPTLPAQAKGCERRASRQSDVSK